jgi:hypothetical protein
MRIILAILLAILPLALLAQTSTVVIVPAALRDAANAVAKQEFDPLGGESTFTAALMTPPATNVTHYWCATPFSATNRAKLGVLANTPPFAGVTLVMDYDLTNGAAPFEFLATHGLAVYSPAPFQTAP